MKPKRFLLTVLIGLNALLAVSLWGTLDPSSRAYGLTARPGQMLCVTAKVAGQEYDLLWVVDTASRKLFAFYPQPGRAAHLVPAPPRDLAKDFNR